MNLFCKKCKNIVTRDLIKFDSKNPIENYSKEVVDEEYEMFKYTYKMGGYHESKHKFHFPLVSHVVYKLNPEDILVNIKKYQGCCSYDLGDIECYCGEYLGTAKDDCWQDTVAYIKKSKVFRGDINL